MNADFYVGLGVDARWIGSVQGLGDPATVQRFALFNDIEDQLIEDYTEDDYRRLVAGIVADAADQRADDPDSDVNGWWADGGDDWPWDHDRSTQTDYSYAWNNGCIHVFDQGYLIAQHYPNGARKPSTFPSMVRQHPDQPMAGHQAAQDARRDHEGWSGL